MRSRLPIIALAALALLAGASAEEAPFFFPDRPGEPLPEARVPDRPRLNAPLLSAKPVPAGGFANSTELKDWATGTVWEFIFPAKPEPGATLYIVRVVLYKSHAEMTWDGGRCGWWASDNKVAALRHSKHHWTHQMRFADDFQSFTFSNDWGTAKLVGRVEQ